MHIRDVIETDLLAILEIHNDAILTSTANWNYHPDTLEGRADLLKELRAKNHCFIAAFEDETLLGYAYFNDFRKRDAYYKTVEHSVYVHKNHHRKGVARSLMVELMNAAQRTQKHVMIGALEASNEPSIALHIALGFIETGRLQQIGYKFNRYMDLVLMQKLITRLED
jgi:L-amino acid N-acyltransferase YncA